MSLEDQATNQLSKLTKKRLALESLIKITVTVQTQQQTLHELAVIGRPSQKFPDQLVNHIKQLSQKIGDLPVSELIQRLETVEQVMADSLQEILRLADIDPEELRAEQITDLSIDEFIDSISNFRRRTQTAVALRCLLKDRGLAISPFALAVPQESIIEHIHDLKIKEKKCVKQVRKEIVSIIKDSDKLLEDENFTLSMKQDICQVRQAMQVNLDHLDKGGKVGDIPNIFETIILESPREGATIQAYESEALDKDVAEQNSETKPKSFWWLLGRWLSSPWSVSWKSLKR